MGSLKDSKLNSASEDTQVHQLSEQEIFYLRMLKDTLVFHTYGQKIMSGFLYYVATNRLGYPKGSNLSFVFDFDKQDNTITVTLLPDSEEIQGPQ